MRLSPLIFQEVAGANQAALFEGMGLDHLQGQLAELAHILRIERLHWGTRITEVEAKMLQEEEDQGCLSILLFHLVIALALTTLFVLFGFIVNLLVHFEANQVKIAWLGGSFLLGGSLSLLIKKLKEKKDGKTKGFRTGQNP